MHTLVSGYDTEGVLLVQSRRGLGAGMASSDVVDLTGDELTESPSPEIRSVGRTAAESSLATTFTSGSSSFHVAATSEKDVPARKKKHRWRGKKKRSKKRKRSNKQGQLPAQRGGGDGEGGGGSDNDDRLGVCFLCWEDVLKCGVPFTCDSADEGQ